MSAQRYYAQLDGLRAIAVTMVLLSHYLVGGPWGDYGVRLFFVLSGFLITASLLSHREHRLSAGISLGLVARNFFIRRALRLFPIYYLALLACVLMAGRWDAVRVDRSADWAFHFAYLTNVLVFLRGEWVGVLSPYWSLAVEEQFYLLWFWLVMLTPRRRLPWVIGLVILSAPLVRLATFLAGMDFYSDVLFPACVDLLGTGALLAVAVHSGRLPAGHREQCPVAQGLGTATNWAMAICLLALLLCSFGADKNSLVRRLLVNLLASILFAYVVYRAYRGIDGGLGALLQHPLLVSVGRCSYGVYVYHMLVLAAVRTFLAPLWGSIPGLGAGAAWGVVLEAFVAAALTLALARLSWRYVETPVLRLKSRFSEGLGSV